jgi:hypothetical protein
VERSSQAIPNTIFNVGERPVHSQRTELQRLGKMVGDDAVRAKTTLNEMQKSS